MRHTILWIVVAVAVIAIGLWWFGSRISKGPSEMPTAGTQTLVAPSNQYVIGNLLLSTDRSLSLGTYLIGFNGMTLYTYAPDTAGVSNCTGQCAAVWPPYIVPDASVLWNVHAGISGAVGSITRADGTIQVTYGGRPVYFYGGDKSSGDTNGQGLGGVWYVIKP